MVWEYNIEVIVMSCREFEMGRKKCELYWPPKGEEFICEPFTVHCDSEENKGDYITRILRVTYRKCCHTVKQLHYVNWPDHGVPQSIPPILEMLQEMRSYQAHDDIPICIHCSAGCGRTGALCVIDYTWNLLRKQMISSDFNVYSLVETMRTQRPSVVQTKEQYLLVYRTIKLLFQQYLHPMDAPTWQNEVTAMAAVAESELSDLSKELDNMPQHPRLLDEEMSALLRLHTPLPSAAENGPDERPMSVSKPLQTSQKLPAVEDGSDDMSSLLQPPSPDVAKAICHMVEDPYFDSPMSSPSSEETAASSPEDTDWTQSPLNSGPALLLNDQTLKFDSTASDVLDEEAPPPLPERTPESYVLAMNAEVPDPCEMLSLVIPPNNETTPGSSPCPSPVPPLPERTPESYELATDQALVEQDTGARPAVNPGTAEESADRSGSSTPDTIFQDVTTDSSRRKHLRAKKTFSAPMLLDYGPNVTSNLNHNGLPLDLLTPAHLPQTEHIVTGATADRTAVPDLTTEHVDERNTMHLHSSVQPLPKVGLSSEWDGTSQPKTFLGVMIRSKSVRTKSSREVRFSAIEPLTVFQQSVSLPVVEAEGGSAQVEHRDADRRTSLNSDGPGNKSDKSSERGMVRSKSLKFFRPKQRPKTGPPEPPAQPEAPPQAFTPSFKVFKFGFGKRFGKPKGPRNYPETWV
ncbi:tyrosine-protein phosphatase non-receptor type 22 isoform X2 [Cololabis saira]|nr:tyrosine-protein phosphatase non-receptor type 22 isoform X2 [Cololabis saira]